ncbi:thermonuclease family protein [Acaryochloris marina]|uniref:thermonuclease family protein n=1 Tax=Acaryochloris marina TaxID=155978 RepID=UPI0008FFD874|nr:thermonuclease family protein [Acaryochloris marina]
MATPRQLLCILFPIAVLGCSPPPSNTTHEITSANTAPVKVLSTSDGDTLKVQFQNGKSSKVRIGCIDAPEYSQEYGLEAGLRLKALIPTGATIKLRKITTDQYDRTVAEIYSEEKSVGLQLVREGYAVVYHRYLDGCSDTANQYVDAENDARSRKLNFWSQSDPVMPWDYRRNRR